MIIRFESPLYQTDQYIGQAFVTLLNYIAVSSSPTELSACLFRLRGRRNPAHYFKWGFTGWAFWVQQRVEYRSDNLFDKRLLTVLRYTPPELLPIKH